MFVLYHGKHPYRVFLTPEEVPEGHLIYWFPQEDNPVPVIRAGNRFLFPDPTGVLRYWVQYEEPTDFALPQARGDALAVFYDSFATTFGLEVWLGDDLVAREIIHQGPMAVEALRAVFGRKHEE